MCKSDTFWQVRNPSCLFCHVGGRGPKVSSWCSGRAEHSAQMKLWMLWYKKSTMCESGIEFKTHESILHWNEGLNSIFPPFRLPSVVSYQKKSKVLKTVALFWQFKALCWDSRPAKDTPLLPIFCQHFQPQKTVEFVLKAWPDCWSYLYLIMTNINIPKVADRRRQHTTLFLQGLLWDR